MGMSKDWAGLTDTMEQGVRSMLNDILGDVANDLAGPVRAISQRLTQAVRRPGPAGDALVAECRDQLSMIALERQLDVGSMGSELFDRMVGMGLNALVNGAIGGIASLKVY